jgi:DeoR family transcriptional regulator of aga operon/DeoR family fructose operon transcriptional repressor
MSLLKSDRLTRIREYVSLNGSATVAELCNLLGVSQATVRRDLDELSTRNLLQRTFGGVTTPSLTTAEPPVFQRRNINAEQKRMIGRLAASMVNNGETVFLGSGSTTLEVARSIKQKRNVTVITNSLPIANLLSDAADVKVIVAGGFLRQTELSMIGHTVEHSLSELRADKVIMGIQGVHVEHGLTNDYLPETKTDRAIVRFAPVVIVVADHSKFGQIKSSFVAELSAVDTIVTDSEAPEDIVLQIRARGIRIEVADAG